MYKYLLAFLLFVSVNASAVDYQTTVTLPTDAKCASGDSEVLIIDEASDFSQINDVGKTIFCVEPGDYTVDLDLTRKGTALAPRYIRYYKSDETSEVHPVHQAEGDRAIIEELFFLSNTEHWVVDRLTVRDAITHSAVRMQPGGGNNIILNRLLVEDSGGSSGMIAGGGDDNVIQGSVIRNTLVVASQDDHCIVFYGDNFKVVGNEIYNCAGDNIQISGSASGGIIADNELYVNSDYYTDCAGNFEPGTGACMCSENALDLKGGGGGSFPFSTSTQLLITDNRIWGFNRDDDNTCATGAGSIGISIIIHGVSGNGDGARFENNIISDTEAGMIGANATAENHTFINNLWYDMDYAFSLPSAKTHNLEFYYNTWLNVDEWFFGNEDVNDFLCNVLVDVPSDGTLTAVGASSNFDYNAYYNSDNATSGNTNDEDHPTAAESLNNDYCWTKNQITNPTSTCVSLAATSTTSPHADLCATPTEAADRGVDDVTQLTRLQAGFLSLSEFFTVTINAVDYDTDPGVSYTFTAPKKGIYQFWFRAATIDEDTNSLSYSVGNRPKQIVRFAQHDTTWARGRLNLNLNPGEQTLTVIEREPGIVIDKITITNDPDFTI